MTAFFDTSAVIALANPDEPLHAWSLLEFTQRQQQGPVVINDIVYAEVSAGMPDRAAVDVIISTFGFERSPPDDDALFAAGQRFKVYKNTNGGPRLNVLADFFIGAAARSLNAALITGNPKDFRKFFSGLTIIHPGGEEIVP